MWNEFFGDVVVIFMIVSKKGVKIFVFVFGVFFLNIIFIFVMGKENDWVL